MPPILNNCTRMNFPQKLVLIAFACFVLLSLSVVEAFNPIPVVISHVGNRLVTPTTSRYTSRYASTSTSTSTTLNSWGRGGKKKDPLKSEISKKRREQLGIGDDEREYDLGVALETNTDPLITKIIAGSFIVVVFALLIAGIVVPSLTDYGEGVCSPIQNGGRC